MVSPPQPCSSPGTTDTLDRGRCTKSNGYQISCRMSIAAMMAWNSGDALRWFTILNCSPYDRSRRRNIRVALAVLLCCAQTQSLPVRWSQHLDSPRCMSWASPVCAEQLLHLGLLDACRHNNCSVMLPPHILVDRCTSVPDAIARCDDDKALSAEVFLICIQLYYQISAFHIRKKVRATTISPLCFLYGSMNCWAQVGAARCAFFGIMFAHRACLYNSHACHGHLEEWSSMCQNRADACRLFATYACRMLCKP